MAADRFSYLLLEIVIVVTCTFGALRLIKSFVSNGKLETKRVANFRFNLNNLFTSSTSKDADLETHVPKFPIHNALAFHLPPLKAATNVHMTMGLRRLDAPNWLTIDSNYLPEHQLRASFIDHDRSAVLAVHPTAEPACHEVLSYVISFLTSRYPLLFTLCGTGSKQTITNHLTGESFAVLNNKSPLETAARLAMEDFNVLIRDEVDGEYHLMASATLFPAGWSLQERIGGTMAALHGPVPDWAKKMGCSVTRYFDKLSPSSAMERFNVFVQTSPDFFQCDTLPSSSPSLSGDRDLGSENKSEGDVDLHPSEIFVRRERQTFVPLPKATAISGEKHVLFAVHTYMTPLETLSTTEIDALIITARNWSDEMGNYKGREGWLDAVVKYRDGLPDPGDDQAKSTVKA